MIRAMAYASRAGATARELAVALDLSLSSVKRLLRTTNA
jgi:DNA-binding IclR family transcriptional regulator